MHTLVVTTSQLWPEASGSSIRAAMTVRGLASNGPVDAAVISKPGWRAEVGPLPIANVVAIPAPVRPANPLLSIRTLVIADRPAALNGLRSADASAALARFVSRNGPYDLVWFESVTSWSWGHGTTSAPCVIDMDDLEDLRLTSQMDATPRDAFLRWRLRRSITGWRRLQRRAARAAAVVAVSSEEDRARAGFPNAVVVPNAYPTPTDANGYSSRSSPTAVFVGLLTYPPNADAVRTLARDIVPLVRAEIPDFELRVIGHAPPALTDALSGPGVTFTGFVEDLDAELRDASITILPITHGGGTRVKALEALAHGIPVIATRVAVHGLAVRHDIEVLLADEPRDLADLTIRVLRDPALALRLATAGHRLYRERYSTEVVEQLVATTARDAVGIVR